MELRAQHVIQDLLYVELQFYLRLFPWKHDAYSLDSMLTEQICKVSFLCIKSSVLNLSDEKQNIL